MSMVFITGADGMLGSSICRELLDCGYEVKALSLGEELSKNIADLPIEIVYGNILDRELLLEEMEGCEYVIHGAAMTQVWPRRSNKINEVNITGTKLIAEVAELLKVKRFVHIGSAASFQEGSKIHPGDENSDYNGWRFGMDYLDSKYLAQKLLLEKHVNDGFNVVIVNPTYMIGAFDSGPSSGKMLVALSKGNIPGYSSGGKNFVCSTDVASAVVNALTLGEPGQCYIAGHENLEYKEFLAKASGYLGKQFKLKKVPQFLIMTVGFSSSVLARIRGKAPKLNYGLARFASVHQYYNPEKAVKVLNMPQTPIEEGIGNAIEWFRKNQYL